MKIGKYHIKISKQNVRTFFRVYIIYLTVSLLFMSEKSSKEHLTKAIIYAVIPFLIEIIFENYYRNNIEKRKNNWFWRGYKLEK